MGLWHNKIPVDVVNLADKDLWAIDSRIAPVEGEYTLLKKRASSFLLPATLHGIDPRFVQFLVVTVVVV